jgi:hypothetical protein
MLAPLPLVPSCCSLQLVQKRRKRRIPRSVLEVFSLICCPPLAGVPSILVCLGSSRFSSALFWIGLLHWWLSGRFASDTRQPTLEGSIVGKENHA